MHRVDNISVNLPNGQSVMVTHIGSIQITPTLLLTDVLCVPSFDFNLIFVSKLTSSLHCCIFFLSTYCFVQDLMHWRMIGMGKQHNGLYLLDVSSDSTQVAAATVSTSSLQKHLYSLSSIKHSSNNFHVWHCRLGHPSLSRMSFLSSIVPNVSHSCNDTHTCIVCPLAKQKRLPFPNKNHLSSTSLDLLHVDIWGPYHVPTVEGYRYFLTLVDDYTRTTWIYLMKSKSDTRSLLTSFILMIQTQFHTMIKHLRSDNGQEFNMPNSMLPKVSFTNIHV